MRIVPVLLASCGLGFRGNPGRRAALRFRHGPRPRDKCAQLTYLTLPNASITTARTYSAGTFVGAAPRLYRRGPVRVLWQAAGVLPGNSRREAFSRLRHQG